MAQRQILVITAEDGNSEQIFQETLQAAEALYPVDKSRIYLVGHSLSGSCAGRLAVAFPEQLAGLCMLGSQYGGQNSTLDQAANIRCCQMPRIDIHGLAEHILPYNKTLGPTSPQVYSNITPTDMGLDASFSEQQFWRDVNHCRPITREEMADIDTTSADPVERKLGIPVDKSRVFALGSVRHFVGDILSEDGPPGHAGDWGGRRPPLSLGLRRYAGAGLSESIFPRSGYRIAGVYTATRGGSDRCHMRHMKKSGCGIPR